VIKTSITCFLFVYTTYQFSSWCRLIFIFDKKTHGHGLCMDAAGQPGEVYIQQ